mmetsp:Transcript_53273/g.169209  ORF Transcript_53273/g.169209 Transcript_53273/m.169209 type:complete len:374 (+) Transcript_53273:4318-5439(+)
MSSASSAVRMLPALQHWLPKEVPSASCFLSSISWRAASRKSAPSMYTSPQSRGLLAAARVTSPSNTGSGPTRSLFEMRSSSRAGADPRRLGTTPSKLLLSRRSTSSLGADPTSWGSVPVRRLPLRMSSLSWTIPPTSGGIVPVRALSEASRAWRRQGGGWRPANAISGLGPESRLDANLSSNRVRRMYSGSTMTPSGASISHRISPEDPTTPSPHSNISISRSQGAGMVPVRLLEPSRSLASFFSVLHCSGMVPWNVMPWPSFHRSDDPSSSERAGPKSASSQICSNSEKDAGRVPPTFVWSMLKTFRLVSTLSSSGIVPVRPLNPAWKKSRERSRESSRGILPIKLGLCSALTCTRLVSPLMRSREYMPSLK